MNYVSAREGVPVPTKPYERAGRAEWVACGKPKCTWRGRPGGFHVCIDLSEPESEESRQPAPSRRLAAKRAKEAERMYAEGMTMQDIADKLGMSYSGVQKALSLLGVPTRPVGRRKKGAA